MVRLYLYVVVAPSRFAPRPFDDGQVRRACTFAVDAFPGVFDTTPTAADARMTLFAVEGDDRCRERALYVHPTGLVELLWALAPEQPTGSDDELLLDTTEMTSVITQLAAAVGRRPYTELSKAGRGWRRRARVDWWFHMATAISGPNGSRSWTALKFPGNAPPRARHEWAAAPIEGYGWPRLRNSRRTKPPEDVARVFLAEFVAANGYYDFTTAVEAAVQQHAAS